MSDGTESNEFRRTRVMLAGREVGVTSYRVGCRFSCRVDNVDPGAVIGRAVGATREEAEDAALASAALTFDLRDASDALRRSVELLPSSKRTPIPPRSVR
jgi:hypothetical protein